MPRQLQLQRSGSVATEPPPGIPGHGQFPISSFPLEKYSFSVIHASEPSISSQWTHYAHRDNLYFVVDTSSVPRPAPCTLLKVVWGSQTLECLDFTALSHQKLAAADLLLPPRPALHSIARSPCLAVRYPGQDNKTIRRFQLRFPSDGVFASVRHILESLNFPIQNSEHPSGFVGQSQLPAQSNQYQSHFQGTSTNVFSQHGTAMSMAQMDPPAMPPLATPAFQFGTSFGSSATYKPSPLPPPRTLPSSLSGVPPVDTPAKEQEIAVVSAVPVEDLPPLRKPTPAVKQKRAPRTKLPAVAKKTTARPPSKSTPAKRARKQSTKGVSGPINTVCREPSPPNASPAGSEGSSTRPGSTKFRSSPPPFIFKQTRPISPLESNKRVRFEASGTTPPPPSSRPLASPEPAIDSSLKGKGKAKDINIPDPQSSPVVCEPIPTDEQEMARKLRLEQERFHALENLIVDKIYDEEFCKLLCDVGRVWQRMGFERGFEDGRLFDIGDAYRG